MDFAMAMSIFLFSIVFVFAFVPGTLQPFTQSAQDETAGSDRVADLIVTDLLTEPGKPYLLDGACTAALMSDAAAPDCDFDGATLPARLDLHDLQSINVTMRGVPPGGTDIERLCWDDNDNQVVGVVSDPVACDDPFVTGETPPARSDSIVTTRRIVSVDGTTATVEVRMW